MTEWVLVNIRLPLKRGDPNTKGFLFHYGHFILDFALPFYKHYTAQSISKLYTTSQCALGTMNVVCQQIYPDVQVINTPSPPTVPTLTVNGYCRLNFHEGDLKKEVLLFHEYVISRANELCVDTKGNWPSIILIERGVVTLHQRHANGATRRSIKNHQALKSTIKARYGADFDNVILEKMDFFKQVLYFYNAQVIIGQYGSGLINVLWSRSQSYCIEITTPFLARIDPVFKKCCLARDVNYISVYSKGADGNAWTVDVPTIMSHIENVYKKTIPSEVEYC